MVKGDRMWYFVYVRDIYYLECCIMEKDNQDKDEIIGRLKDYVDRIRHGNDK